VRKILLDKEHRYRTTVIAISLLLVLINICIDSVYTFILFPIYAFSVFLYYYKQTKKFNWIFLLYLVSTMLSEIGFIYDFTTYLNTVLLLTLVVYISMIILLKPVLKIKFRDFETHNLTELIIGFIGISCVLGFALYQIFPLIPDLSVFVPVLAAFLIVNVVCIGIPFFNKHPKAILLWGVGGGLIAEVCSAFIYEYLSDARIFLIMSYIFTLFLKFTLALFLTKLDDIAKSNLNKDYL